MVPTGRAPGAVSQGAKATAEPEAEEENELDALRKQMAAMQKKLDDLGN